MELEKNDDFLGLPNDFNTDFEFNTIEENDLAEDVKISFGSGGKTPPPPSEVNWRLTTDHLGGFESSNQATCKYGKGYLVDAAINRQPYTNDIRRGDKIYMAFWCSSKNTQMWYSRIDDRVYKGSQTGWIPAGPGGLSNTAAAIWIPTPNYDPARETVVHSLFVMRKNSYTKEIVVWQPSNGAPFPYTGHPRLTPKDPSEDRLASSLRRQFKISPNNPRGLELWGKPSYRSKL